DEGATPGNGSSKHLPNRNAVASRAVVPDAPDATRWGGVFAAVCFFGSRLRARLAGSKAPRRRGALQDASRVHRPGAGCNSGSGLMQWGQVRTFDNLNPKGFRPGVRTRSAESVR